MLLFFITNSPVKELLTQDLLVPSEAIAEGNNLEQRLSRMYLNLFHNQLNQVTLTAVPKSIEIAKHFTPKGYQIIGDNLNLCINARHKYSEAMKKIHPSRFI